MKTNVSAIIALFILLFAPFAQAGVPVPEKVIVSDTVVIERFYNHNENYKTQYTIPVFNKKVCSLNPKRFKKCSDYEFRHQQKGVVYFPAIPEIKVGVTIKQAYKKNEIYRTLFITFTKFQQEICKNNMEILKRNASCAIKNLKTTVNLKVTDRPKTYIIHGENADSVMIDNKVFIKSKKGEYYTLTKPTIIETIKTSGEIKILETITKKQFLRHQQNKPNKQRGQKNKTCVVFKTNTKESR